MINWLHYLVEANIYLSVFYLFYCVFLTKETHYTLNRVYLLGSSFIAFILPLIQVGILKPVEPLAQRATVLPGNEVYALVPIHTPIAVETPVLTVQDVFIWGYVVGATIAAILLIFKFYKLYTLGKTRQGSNEKGYQLIYLENSTTAFSFFNYLFIGSKAPGKETIIRHELVHIRQKHSVDMMLMEAFKIINWFNPLIYLLQNSLKTVHEYIADEQTAAKETDTITYSTFLVNNAYGISGPVITHSFFNYNLLKKRIIMLHQQRSGKLARLKYLMAAPICAALLCASTLGFSKTYGWVDLAPKAVIKPVEKIKKFPPPTVTKNGYEGLVHYVMTKVEYPKTTLNNGHGGFVLATFNNKNHKIADFKIIKKVGYGLDEEIEKAFNSYPYNLPNEPGLHKIAIYFYTGGEKPLPLSVYKDPNFVGSITIAAPIANRTFAPPPPPMAPASPQQVKFPHPPIANRFAPPVVVPDHQTVIEADQTKKTKLIIVNDEKYTLKEPLKPGQSLSLTASDSVIVINPGNAKAIAKWGHDADNGVTMLYGKTSITIVEDFNKFYDKLGKTIRYPANAYNDNITGKVFASFTVDADSKIQEIEILRGPLKSINDEVTRAINNCGQIAGTKQGITYVIPINFVINGYEGKATPSIDLTATKSVHNPANEKVYMNEVVIYAYKTKKQ